MKYKHLSSIGAVYYALNCSCFNRKICERFLYHTRIKFSSLVLEKDVKAWYRPKANHLSFVLGYLTAFKNYLVRVTSMNRQLWLVKLLEAFDIAGRSPSEWRTFLENYPVSSPRIARQYLLKEIYFRSGFLRNQESASKAQCETVLWSVSLDLETDIWFALQNLFSLVQ